MKVARNKDLSVWSQILTQKPDFSIANKDGDNLLHFISDPESWLLLKEVIRQDMIDSRSIN